jgi:AraC-like DNA-binding protein
VLKKIEKDKLVANIKALIAINLSDGDIHISAIARQYQLTERQLKSKLADKGTSFSDLLAQVRSCRAIELLSSGEKSITEISDACGFSEPSVFNRAFKRWFAKTPSKYRTESLLE